MYTLFKNRTDAGRQLAEALKEYKGIIYALPRGGVVVAKEIANRLKVPLDLLFARKIGHPYYEEYAIGAVSESGQVVGGEELTSFGKEWLNEQVQYQLKEIKRRRELYLKGKPPLDPKDKVAILVDDGIATGLTMEAGIKELRGKHPSKIVVAVPVSPKDTYERLKMLADEVVCIEVPEHFHGAVGAYYMEFSQVEDSEVVKLLI